MPETIREKCSWMFDLGAKDLLRPYVYVRTENQILSPGSRHISNWFPIRPLFKNPLNLGELPFGEMIYHLEGQAFGAKLAMPRWVFYDCAAVPGFCCGFAIRREALTPTMKKILKYEPTDTWIPISLFIIIPTMRRGEWVAHNLCAINSLVPAPERFYGLGFLSKAFGLWYANVETCCGIAQWGSPAVKLHVNYGHMELLTSYTPLHTHAETMTYRSQIKTSSWKRFFAHERDDDFFAKYEPSGEILQVGDEQSMRHIQALLQDGKGPYFLSPEDFKVPEIPKQIRLFQPV